MNGLRLIGFITASMLMFVCVVLAIERHDDPALPYFMIVSGFVLWCYAFRYIVYVLDFRRGIDDMFDRYQKFHDKGVPPYHIGPLWGAGYWFALEETIGELKRIRSGGKRKEKGDSDEE